MASSRATTTFMVRDRTDLDEEMFVELIRDALQREGGPTGPESTSAWPLRSKRARCSSCGAR
ncbi:MAG: hypothetical protein ACRDXD_00965 [Acidimicrobiia bacterium]